MSKQLNIEAQQKFGEAVNTGNFELFKEVVAPNALDNDPAPGQLLGPEGYMHFFTMMRTAFPDFKVEVEHLVADENNVAFAYTATGTHQGNFNGIPATGKSIKIRGMQISRFENGKMVERWGSSDELGILKQLGVQVG
ncbi:ester cyclase [Mucilaginibacter robiniae]|uniref:Ester cyclase n=1 Tax=Mucilaginibacter robiniae TaxID=2728022 RepID=A0A7L5DZ35_9SPHI|nr:ester cyclase [Mucilaginibacter robiniae]QJD96372.1 ester cyclase [Mucilaginibacter robiniae]